MGKQLALNKRRLGLGAIILGAGLIIGFSIAPHPQEIAAQSSTVLNVVTPDDVQNAFAAEQPAAQKEKPVAIILPHHLVARSLIARAITSVRNAQPETIVVLGPDHENRGLTLATTSAASWASSWFTYQANSKVTAELQSLSFVRVSDEIIRQEHSVLHPLPFLQQIFPQARYALITMRGGFDESSVNSLAQKLDEILGENDLVVASVDFSHQTTAQVAQDWDKQSLSALQAGELAKLKDIHADSPQALAVAMAFAKLRQAGDFRVLDQSTAAAIQQDPNQPNTTSYITGYWGK